MTRGPVVDFVQRLWMDSSEVCVCARARLYLLPFPYPCSISGFRFVSVRWPNQVPSFHHGAMSVLL